MDWQNFFRNDELVIALPNWSNPKLYFPQNRGVDRWNVSGFYPAFRSRARLFRLALRLGTFLNLFPARRALPGDSTFIEQIRTFAPEFVELALLVGTQGPHQKMIARLYDAAGSVIGYLKYGESEPAKQRLCAEAAMLEHLGKGQAEIAPKLLGCGPIGNGIAILLGTVPGKNLSTHLPPAKELFDLLRTMVNSDEMDLSEHPWACRMIQYDPKRFGNWLGKLTRRQWPMAIQHGDLAPWNIIRTPADRLVAIDWEYGTAEGFPYLDLIQYILQTAALVHRWTPNRAYTKAMKLVIEFSGRLVSETDASLLVKMGAYDAYSKAVADNPGTENTLQRWRRYIWEKEVPCDG